MYTEKIQVTRGLFHGMTFESSSSRKRAFETSQFNFSPKIISFVAAFLVLYPMNYI